jgi:hypothetical protein
VSLNKRGGSSGNGGGGEFVLQPSNILTKKRLKSAIVMVVPIVAER